MEIILTSLGLHLTVRIKRLTSDAYGFLEVYRWLHFVFEAQFREDLSWLQGVPPNVISVPGETTKLLVGQGHSET